MADVFKISSDALQELADLLKGKESESELAKTIVEAVYPKKTIINLTKHSVNIVDKDDRIIRTFPPESAPARSYIKSEIVEWVDEVPIYEKTDDPEVANLPPKRENTYYIVSRTFAMEAPTDRDDLLTVNRTHRDEYGRVIGSEGLIFV